METNREKLERLGVIDDIDIQEAAGDRLCEICDKEIEKNLNPQNPCCEGRWCEEAAEIWLDEPAEEDGE